ncbi:MAG TPA: hypothetical protein VJN88_15150, partial [Ktedonobacterales bacterium]|nr:hypothetical protein [Ktedonobacterales bacterium]
MAECGPLTTAQGNYAYNTANASGHLHAVSSVSGSETYSAGYDAAGDMTCRAVGSLSCTTNGTPTGQLLGYDPLRRLIAWQNATTSATYAYDGAGSRVWQQTTSGSGSFQTITTTAYLLGHDEQTTTQVSGRRVRSAREPSAQRVFVRAVVRVRVVRQAHPWRDIVRKPQARRVVQKI